MTDETLPTGAAEPAFTRRVFCRTASAFVPAMVLGVEVPGTAAAQAARPAMAGAMADAQRRYLTEAEWRFVIAACDRLIPEDEEGPGALSCHVPVFIDRQLAGEFGQAARWYMDGPYQPDAAPDRGYQLGMTPAEVYRAAIADIDAHCEAASGSVFAALSADDQVRVLSQIEDGTIRLPHVPAEIFFKFLLANTKEGYFADPIHGGNHDMQAWRMIGYPGVRASYLEWVDRHGTPYPLGPVDIMGQS